MPENDKEKNTDKEKTEERKDNSTDESQERSYYYDDACGYEIYIADEDEDS